MPRHGTLILSACIAASWIPCIHAKSGALWCGTLMCVDAVIRGNTVSYEMKALNQLGWMAIGFGTSMNNTPVVVMWPNEDGSVTLSQRLATGHVEPHPDPSPSRVATVSNHMDITSDTSPILAFDMTNTGDSVQSLIWAFGVTSPNSTDPSADIEQHLDAGTFSLDLSKTGDGDDDGGDDDGKSSTSTPSSSATSTSGSSSLPVSSASTSSSSIQTSSSHSSSTTTASSSFSTSAQSSAVPAFSSSSQENHHTILAAHALLCFLGFAVVLPLAAVIARWGRTTTNHWFRAHWITIVALGLPTMLPGWALGLVLVSRERHKHVVNEHQIVGVVIFSLCLLQMSVGTFIRWRSSLHAKQAHPPRNVVHILLGLIIIALALYETFTGISHTMLLSSTTKKMLTIGCALWTIAVVAAYLTGLTRLRRQLDQERLGWHLPVPSRPRSPQTAAAMRDGPLVLLGSSSPSRRPGREGRDDDDIDDLLRHISSRDGPTSQAAVRASSVIEMRELERPLPISVRF
ncbi:hypothetical protein PHLGIDRAFT_478785 [Phlebiopsis gigantea 11061_1 CR5-6]|uniref:Cytochrome b561 domain-containing protein n=1 Tax=Phlebiopsis gigantea (strain 11061_1 CR5-6) TaxID=745531 RepID=A0A0C3PIX7_PHLG1|nr:hypothetical protein PHLGIDRAFT_478785 [Phlebiopsis gigantea 11061_1 CR5-6]